MTRHPSREEESRSFTTILSRAGELADDGNHEGSIVLLRDALRRFANEPGHWLEAAIYGYESALEEALGWVEEATRLGAKDPNLLTRCAAFLVSMHAFDAAEQVIQAVGRIAPEGGFDAEWAFLHTAGRLASQVGDPILAEEWLAAAFHAQPDVPIFGEKLARFLEYLGRPREALDVLDESLRSNPQDEYLLAARREIQSRLA